MRSPQEIVDALRAELVGDKLKARFVVVAFDDTTELVDLNDDDAADQLQQLMWKGGSPVGHFRFELSDQPLRWSGGVGLLREYQDDEELEKYLINLLASFQDGLLEEGWAKAKAPLRRADG